MSWLPKYYTRTSDKNGTISVYRGFFSRWQVSVGDTGQTTLYTHAMWIDAFKRLSGRLNKETVRDVLMLGLGAGGEVATIHKHFPNCTLTAVEYDKEMVALAKETGLYKPYPFPEVLVGDAAEVVPTITKKFDLVILDLFNGQEPSPLAEDKQFVSHLQTLLAPKGTLLINIYKRKEYLAAGAALFPFSQTWEFRLNNLGAFWNE